jgi:hypothetical protein
MARFNEERDDESDQIRIHSCTDITSDNDCLQAGCPGTSERAIICVADPNRSISEDNQEAAILDPCTAHTLGQVTSEDITCLRENFDLCSVTNDPGSKPDGSGFGACMSSSCTTVSSAAIICISNSFGSSFTG